MTIVRVYEDEPFEIILKMFKRKCLSDGIFVEVRKRRCYEKPSVRRRKKIASERREAMKKGFFKSR